MRRLAECTSARLGGLHNRSTFTQGKVIASSFSRAFSRFERGFCSMSRRVRGHTH